MESVATPTFPIAKAGQWKDYDFSVTLLWQEYTKEYEKELRGGNVGGGDCRSVFNEAASYGNKSVPENFVYTMRCFMYGPH